MDFANIIREEAVLFLLDLPRGDEVSILAQKKKDGQYQYKICVFHVALRQPGIKPYRPSLLVSFTFNHQHPETLTTLQSIFIYLFIYYHKP